MIVFAILGIYNFEGCRAMEVTIAANILIIISGAKIGSFGQLVCGELIGMSGRAVWGIGNRMFTENIRAGKCVCWPSAADGPSGPPSHPPMPAVRARGEWIDPLK